MILVINDKKTPDGKRIERELKKFKNSYTAIGYWGHGGTPANDLAARAAVNEFGAEIKVTEKMKWWWFFNFGKKLVKTVIKIWSRPFMRLTFDKNKMKINEMITLLYNGILEGKYTAKKALARAGEWYVGEVKSTINEGKFIGNSTFTKEKKGSSKPLIDTGQLRNSVEHREFING